MSQRSSGRARQAHDLYETPEWASLVLAPHLPEQTSIWEPACGSGKMVNAFLKSGFEVFGTDICSGVDFLTCPKLVNSETIATNPPYTYAKEFIETALRHTKDSWGIVAMLLRTDYDHAKTRSHLFAKCPVFSKKIVLTRRIVWFERKGAAPSFNHAWFIWDWKHRGPPTLPYDVAS